MADRGLYFNRKHNRILSGKQVHVCGRLVVGYLVF
ncbi:unnamed protein product, partial [marine sediment metagenome]